MINKIDKQQKMKIAQILYSGLGGHGSVAFSLIDADKEGEWKPLMGFLGIAPLADAYAEQCKSKNIAFDYIAAVQGKPWKSWTKVFDWLKKEEPNAIILHSMNALLPCWLYARYKRVPLIVVEHTPNNLKRKSEWMVSRLAMWLGDAVVLLTQAYQNELKQKLGGSYHESKVDIIPNGIDTDRFSLLERRSLDRSKTIWLGMAARFSDTKRQDALIDMLALLRQKSPSVDYRLTLAGDGDTWESLHQKVKDAELEEYIRFSGYLGEDELLEWFKSIDIYFHASEGETLSTSLLQAMSMGLPIVASDVPGITNLLQRDEECGLLVKNSKPEGFADAVNTLVYDPVKTKALSALVRQYAVDIYSQDVMFSAYNKIIKGKIK